MKQKTGIFFTVIYFAFVFSALFALFYPAFHNPPRSDYWSTAYFFHRIDTLAGWPAKWLAIMEYDPYSQVRFQPLAYPMLYAERCMFGAAMFFHYLVNFIFYCISILLLYVLAVKLKLDKILSALFAGFFAFLFSHFDILCWSFHIYVVVGFCSLLAAFIFYVKYLESGRKMIFLPVVALFFLAGMLCYESFILCPLAVVFLYRKVGQGRHLKPTAALLAALYIAYFFLFFLSRVFNVYPEPLIGTSVLFSVKMAILNLAAVSSGVLYNGLLVNAVPFLAIPPGIKENISLGGLLASRSVFYINAIIVKVGICAAAFIVGLAIWSRKRLKREMFLAFAFFMFLLFSELFMLFHLRSLTNAAVYNLTQFRYFYVANALTLFGALCLVDGLVRNKQRAFYAAVTAILICLAAVNVSVTRQYGIAVLNRQLEPLGRLLRNIESAMDKGVVSPREKLYLSDDIASSLPPLCWNRDMGRLFMRGTYQWIFPAEKIACFGNFDEAKWVVDKASLGIVEKMPPATGGA